MNAMTEKLAVLRSIIQNPQIIRVKPSINWFLLQYLKKFQIQDIEGNLIIHSHLPPLNSKAYARFIDEHLLARTEGPSHAQIGLTNACPQKCAYCYNRERKGKVMDTTTIKRIIQDLKSMGVIWLGFTGGEPLLNRDIIEIIELAASNCAVKLFTTGCTLTKGLARDLRQAGLFSVSVSLDYWEETVHDQARGYKGAFQTAVKAIEIFKSLGDLHVGVSAVLTKEMIMKNQVEEFLQFLSQLEIHEAWLSEAKPSVAAFRKDEFIITEDERLKLVRLQDQYNKAGKMTINYLGHFEGRQHFGCNAGNKMLYVDAFGEVSPCVFTPMSFGNVQEKSVIEIFKEMKNYFPSEDGCFINKNYRLFQKYDSKGAIISREDSEKLLQEVQFGRLAKFFQLYYR